MAPVPLPLPEQRGFFSNIYCRNQVESWRKVLQYCVPWSFYLSETSALSHQQFVNLSSGVPPALVPMAIPPSPPPQALTPCSQLPVSLILSSGVCPLSSPLLRIQEESLISQYVQVFTFFFPSRLLTSKLLTGRTRNRKPLALFSIIIKQPE